MRTRVVVVGGGVAGLVAAADLARSGLQPVLLEAAPQLGGRAQTRVVDGFCFNQGSHAFYAAGAFKAALDDFGVKVSAGQADVGNGLALWGDDVQRWPIRPADEAAPPLDPADRTRLRAELRRIGQGDYDGRGQPLRAVTEPLPARVRNVIEALVRVTNYTHAPNLLDAKAAFDQLRRGFDGALYVDGGWGGLVDGLAAAARKAGAELRTETRVSAVGRQERGWRVDIFGEASIACDAVILALPPSDASAVAASSKAVAALLDDLAPARIMGLDLALSDGVHPRASFILGMTGPTYVATPSAVARVAPEGGVMAHLVRYLGPEETANAEAIDELETLADGLLPGWRAHEIRRQRWVGMTVSHDIPRWQTAGRRAAGRVAGATGLYLAGDWIGDHEMLADAAAASAKAAAAEVATFLSQVPAI
ncbi:MAG TPA: FAD-dependent oxidoreductase [Caulobacteraceae bacterium]|jgi:phytoene dehydrogenase-like protein